MKGTYLSIFIILLLISCSDEKKNVATLEEEISYSEKANELISSILIQEDCDCISEIPKQSMRATLKNENPNSSLDPRLMRNLGIKNIRTLDSLDSLSNHFRLDEKIKTIPKSTSLETKKINDSLIHRFCKKGVLYVSKPLFDKNYLNAAVDVQMGTCIPFTVSFYQFDGEHWVKK